MTKQTTTLDRVKIRVQLKTTLNMLDNPEFMALMDKWDKEQESQARGGALRHVKAGLRELIGQLKHETL